MNNNLNKVVDSYEIKYSEKEELALNIVNYFLENENYSLFNVPEKMLENFSHPLYDLIFVSTERIHSSEAVISLEKKLTAVKKKIAKTYLIPNPTILFISLDCNITFDVEELPKNVEFISINSIEELLKHPIMLEDFPKLTSAKLDYSFKELSTLINQSGMMHLKKVKSTLEYTRKPWGYMVLIMFNVLWYLYYIYQNFLLKSNETSLPFALNKESIRDGAYWLFLTNSFVNEFLLSLIAALVFISYFGRLTEKIYGSLRFLGIMTFSIVLSNTVGFAFTSNNINHFGFFPIILGFFGALMYATLNYRRYLMVSFRKMILPFTSIYLLFTAIFNFEEIYWMIGAILGGLLGAIIFGLPKKESKMVVKRFVLLIGFIIIIVLSVVTGT